MLNTRERKRKEVEEPEFWKSEQPVQKPMEKPVEFKKIVFSSPKYSPVLK